MAFHESSTQSNYRTTANHLTSITIPRVISSQKFCALNKLCTMQSLLYGVYIAKKTVNGKKKSTIETSTSKIGDMTSDYTGRQTKKNLKFFPNVFKNICFLLLR